MYRHVPLGEVPYAFVTYLLQQPPTQAMLNPLKLVEAYVEPTVKVPMLLMACKAA